MTPDPSRLSVTRRLILCGGPALAAGKALALDPPQSISEYERAVGGRVGFFAENRSTGAKIYWRADERFVMCSTFKASLAALVLRRVDEGKDRLEEIVRFGPNDLEQDWWAPVAKASLARGALTVEEVCAGAVEDSDNTCANLLLARVGGPAALTAFWRFTGDGVTRLDHKEPLLNRSPPGDPHDTTTPRAMADNLGHFLLGDVLSPASRDRLTNWMVNCTTGARRLRAGLPQSWRIGDKTGNNGKDAAGDIALVWPRPATPLAIAAYVQGGSPTTDQIDGIFREIGRIVSEKLV